MAITPAGLRLDLRKTGRKGKPCGESHIPADHECGQGKGRASKKQGGLSSDQKKNIVVGAVYLGLTAVALKQIQNSKAAYNLKFGGNEALTPLSKPIGKELNIKVGEQMGDPSAFGQVFKATDKKGTPLVVKIPNKGGGGGANMTMQMRNQGFDKRAVDNIRTSQTNITSQEAKAAKLAGDLGFGPKLRYADKDGMVMEVAKGQALVKQTAGPLGTNLSSDQKKSVIGAMAKMHGAGMAHNDLHSGNIFVEKNGQGSFIDWGTATNGGGAVAGEWARMQNRPRLGLTEAGGMGFNLRSVTPAETRFTERKIKKIIGKKIGALTEVDIQRAIKKNPNLNDQLQEAVNEYYNNVFFLNRTDAMDLLLTAGQFKFDDEGEGGGEVHGPSDSFTEALLEQGIDTNQYSAGTKLALALAEQHGAEQEKQSHERHTERETAGREWDEKFRAQQKEEKQEEKLAAEEERQAKARHEYHQYKQMRAKEHREHVLTAGLLGIGKQSGNSIMATRSKSSEDKKDAIDLTAGFIRGDACWKGYIQKGTKRKGNRVVPNCVPAGKRKAEIRRKAGQDGEDQLTSAKRTVWAEGFEPKKTKARR